MRKLCLPILPEKSLCTFLASLSFTLSLSVWRHTFSPLSHFLTLSILMSFVPAHQQEPLKAEKTGGCDGPDIHFEKTGT